MKGSDVASASVRPEPTEVDALRSELARMERDYNEVRVKIDDLGAVFAFIEQEARDSRYGVTIEWVVGAEGEAYGFSFGRQRYIGPPLKTAQQAIERARSDLRRRSEGSGLILADAHSKDPSRPAMPKEEDIHG